MMHLGYELECGVNAERYEDDDGNDEITINPSARKIFRELHFDVGSDGSVEINNDDSYALELKSRIYDFNTDSERKIIFDDYAKIQEYISEVNETCGLHFHISFTDIKDYFSVCCYEFADNFIKEYAKKFKSEKEQNRIYNHYCEQYTSKENFTEFVRLQLRSNSKNEGRYKCVNYNAYNLYNTIEFRIFPSTDSEKKFKDYVEFLFNFVTDFLSKADISDKELIKKKSYKEKEEKKIIDSDEIIAYELNSGYNSRY